MVVGGIILFLPNLYRQTSTNRFMKFTKVSTRALFGGLLGLCLAFYSLKFVAKLYDIFSTSTFYGSGHSPNAIAEWLYKISWALLFCAGWWMFWNFDNFFTPVNENTLCEAEETQNAYTSSSEVKDDETFKPESEGEQEQEDPKHASKNEHSETNEDTEEETSENNASFDIQDEKFLQVLKIDEKSSKILLRSNPFTEKESPNIIQTKFQPWDRKSEKWPNKKPKRLTRLMNTFRNKKVFLLKAYN